MGVVRGGLIASATATLTVLAGCMGGAPRPSEPAATGSGSATAPVVSVSPTPPPPSLPPASTASSSAAPPAAPSAQASTLDPLVVEPTETEVTASVGRRLSFNVGPHPGLWRITSGNEAIVGELTQGVEAADAKLRPGAKALGVGSATITLENADGHEPLLYKITVIP